MGDGSVSAKEIARLFGVLNNSRASPILVPVQTKKQNNFPNPLLLVVYVGSGKYLVPEGGIEIGFSGELVKNPSSVPGDKVAIEVVADKTVIYTIRGKQISKSDLKIAVENRLKTKEKNKKVVFFQVENYANIEDPASIAHSAGAAKVFLITKNLAHKENGISFSIPPTFTKDKDNREFIRTN